MVNSLLSSLIIKNLIEITREPDIESLIYCYSIYNNSNWFVLTIDIHLDIISSSSFYHILSLWNNVMWLQSHTSLSSKKEKNKTKNQIKENR